MVSASGAWQVVKSAGNAINDMLDRVQPWCLVVLTAAGTVAVIRFRRVLRRSDRPLTQRFTAYVFSLLRQTSFMKKKLEGEILKTRCELLKVVHKCDKERKFIRELPVDGFSSERIISLAAQYNEMCEVDVSAGRVSGTVYSDHEENHIRLLDQIFHMFSYSNPLHPEVFPGCRKMEAEIIRIVADMYHGDAETCGTMTTGGTESILLAMLAYRNRAYSKGHDNPEILVPVTGHAAFDKAAEIYGIRIRHIPVGPANAVDVAAMRKAITSDTCVLVCSAPCFPSGTIDNVEKISQIGRKYNIPVHVDACLGGFLIPFMEEAGFKLPLFDFRLRGVTSISCDTHKYGYAPKGSSVVLYRNKEYLHHQYFCIPEWTGGIYATPTFAGSRCGSSIALTWATLLLIGREGYVKRTRSIIECARKITEGICGNAITPGIEGLKLLGSADVSVVAFTSDVLNIYAISDRMSSLGWNLNTLQNPAAIHICVTLNTAVARAADSFLDDLRKVTREVLNDPKKGSDSKTASIYGLAASIPDKTLVSEIAFEFLDACYAMPSVGFENRMLPA